MTDHVESLFCVCVKRISFLCPPNLLSELLPEKLAKIVERFQSSVLTFHANIPNASVSKFPRSSFVVDPTTIQLDLENTVLRLEQHLSPTDFFDLCARYGLDNPADRVYQSLSREQCDQLMTRNAASRCRILELSQRQFVIYYDEIALECASSGLLAPLERSLMKINPFDESLLPKCVLQAIINGHFDIANHIQCENFERAFYSVFPDGRVPVDFFVKLIDSDGTIFQGDQIAFSLLRYLPSLDVQRLRRLLERDPSVKKCIISRFDSMYSEILDSRDYPCDYD